jgi:hypothetical protein
MNRNAALSESWHRSTITHKVDLWTRVMHVNITELCCLFLLYSCCWRMASYGMLRRVALVRTDVSEERTASIIRMTRIGELGTTLAATSVVPSSPIVILMKEELRSSEASPLTRATRRNNPEDIILQLYRVPPLDTSLCRQQQPILEHSPPHRSH